MNANLLHLWNNYRTGQIDARAEPPDGEEWRDYISQNPAAQSLFNLYLEMGDPPIEAAKKVLLATIEAYRGRPQEEATP